MEGKALVTSAQIHTSASRHAYNMQPISCYRVTDEISELAIISNVHFFCATGGYKLQTKIKRGKGNGFPLNAGMHVTGLNSSHYSISGVLQVGGPFGPFIYLPPSYLYFGSLTSCGQTSKNSKSRIKLNVMAG